MNNPITKTPAALVMHDNGLFFEDQYFKPNRFAVRLFSDKILCFERVPASPACFAATEVISAHSPDLNQPALVAGVLWSQWAMPAVAQCTDAYPHRESRPFVDDLQLYLSRYRHGV